MSQVGKFVRVAVVRSVAAQFLVECLLSGFDGKIKNIPEGRLWAVSSIQSRTD